MNVPETLQQLLDGEPDCDCGRPEDAAHKSSCSWVVYIQGRAWLEQSWEPLAQAVLAQHKALENTNCRRVEESGFVAAMCSFPEQGTGPDDIRGPLPKEQWCDRCLALELTPLAEAMSQTLGTEKEAKG